MLFLKQVANDLGLALAPVQVSTHTGHHFGAIGRAALAQRIGFDILVEQLIGIELRTVAWQANEANLGGIILDEALSMSGAMHWMAVHDQIDLPGRLLEQALHEADEQARIELAVENHEGQMPAIGDRRDHIAAEALTCGAHDRCLPHRSIAGSSDMIAAQAHLITPVNHGSFLLSMASNRRVLLAQPMCDVSIVTLVRPSRSEEHTSELQSRENLVCRLL